MPPVPRQSYSRPGQRSVSLYGMLHGFSRGCYVGLGSGWWKSHLICSRNDGGPVQHAVQRTTDRTADKTLPPPVQDSYHPHPHISEALHGLADKHTALLVDPAVRLSWRVQAAFELNRYDLATQPARRTSRGHRVLFNSKTEPGPRTRNLPAGLHSSGRRARCSMLHLQPSPHVWQSGHHGLHSPGPTLLLPRAVMYLHLVLQTCATRTSPQKCCSAGQVMSHRS